MSDLIERLRDKKRLRAAHGLTGWVLAEEALLAQAADEIERLRQWETCGQEWLCKTDWVQERVNAGSWPISALGKHRADVMREEIERLTAALQYEQHRAGRQGTHGEGCADWGPEHYECAIRERDDLRRQLAEAELDAERYRWLRGDLCPDHSVRWTQWEVRCWKAPSWTGDLRRADLDDAIDAARGKE